MVVELKNTTEFAAAIGNDETGLVVVDFYAQWCGPCKRISPEVDGFVEKYSNVGFYKIDVDNKDLMKICTACKIKSLPTFCFFSGGKYINEMIGANVSGLEKMIKDHLDNMEKRSNLKKEIEVE